MNDPINGAKRPIEPTPIPLRSKPPNPIWAILALVVLAVFSVWLVRVSDENPQPMPCEKDEVYVWEDYPTDAACVSNTDHEAHMGH